MTHNFFVVLFLLIFIATQTSATHISSTQKHTHSESFQVLVSDYTMKCTVPTENYGPIDYLTPLAQFELNILGSFAQLNHKSNIVSINHLNNKSGDNLCQEVQAILKIAGEEANGDLLYGHITSYLFEDIITEDSGFCRQELREVIELNLYNLIFSSVVTIKLGSYPCSERIQCSLSNTNSDVSQSTDAPFSTNTCLSSIWS